MSEGRLCYGKRLLSLPNVSRVSKETDVQTKLDVISRDVQAVVKSIKTHFKNGMLARECILTCHSRLEDDDSKEWFSKFQHTTVGGLSVVIAAMEYHCTDALFSEAASHLLCTLINFSGKKQLRVIQKVAKRGGSKLSVTLLNIHKAQNARLFANICNILCVLTSVDIRTTTMCRLSGGITTLVGVMKNGPSETLSAALTCICSLCSKCDGNVQAIVKKGAVPTLTDLTQRILNSLIASCENPQQQAQQQQLMLLRYVCKTINLLTRVEEAVGQLVREGAVMTMFRILEMFGTVGELQRLALDTIRVLADNPDGMSHFRSVGGTQKIVSLLLDMNNDKTGDQLLDIVNHLFKFHDICELPIRHEEEVTFNIKATPESQGRDDEGTPADQRDMSVFSPELSLFDVHPYSQLGVTGSVEPFSKIRPLDDLKASPSCASVLEYVPQASEELHVTSEAAKTELMKHELLRLTMPERVMNVVVYDDIQRTVSPPQPLFPGMFEVGGKELLKKSHVPSLTFSSRFESGNLKRVLRVYATEYDLILNCDVNSAYHTQWFYFSVENIVPGIPYKFNIINLEKTSSLFNEGQQPVFFSEREFTKHGKGWHRNGTKVAYMRNPYRKRDPMPCDIDRVVTLEKKKSKPSSSKKEDPASAMSSAMRRLDYRSQGTYYTLTFTVTFKHEDDRCYFAHSYPYTYSDLQRYLRLIPQQYPNVSDYLENQELCKSVGRNSVNLLTITTMKRPDGSSVPQEEIAQRKVCFISARVHPGESCSSWMVKGLIDFLIDPYIEEAKQLRDRIVWKIVPMLNPDGVINGNYRCSLTCRDLNREWHQPSLEFSPEILAFKNLVKQVKTRENRNVLVFCDMHGHSRHRNFFMYGCNPVRRNVVVTPSLILERVLPKILSDMVPGFCYGTSSFKVQKAKEATGRVVVWRELGIRLSYTIEASMMGGTMYHYNTQNYMDIGKGLCHGLAPFLSIEGDPAILRLGDIVHELITSIGGPNAAITPAAQKTRPPQQLPRAETMGARELIQRKRASFVDKRADRSSAVDTSASSNDVKVPLPQEQQDEDDDDDDDEPDDDDDDDDDEDEEIDEGAQYIDFSSFSFT
eukprot:TRINITY_DN2415_c0_g2_i1.p1 TRINITY_DN2415_c0_g2~~TRINITY_DN2415_c0_g2_i1.p1  ORF type:complete len:1096 (+),score=220.27 TRINITY_DN2415_c0_g2_i1:104-3391(+)